MDTLTAKNGTLHADLIEMLYTAGKHYTVDKDGKLVGRLSKRADGTNPSPGWWARSERDGLLKFGDKVRYFPTAQDALDALEVHLDLDKLLTPTPTPTPKQPAYPTRYCRRPYCAQPFTGENAANDRTVHEAKETPLHLKHGMDFLCDWEGHAEAITTAGLCPVCQ